MDNVIINNSVSNDKRLGYFYHVSSLKKKNFIVCFPKAKFSCLTLWISLADTPSIRVQQETAGTAGLRHLCSILPSPPHPPAFAEPGPCRLRAEPAACSTFSLCSECTLQTVQSLPACTRPQSQQSCSVWDTYDTSSPHPPPYGEKLHRTGLRARAHSSGWFETSLSSSFPVSVFIQLAALVLKKTVLKQFLDS